MDDSEVVMLEALRKGQLVFFQHALNHCVYARSGILAFCQLI